MIKGKPRFNPKEFFILHCEKMVLILFVPLAIYLAMQGMKYEPLTWKPDELTQLSTQAKTHVDSNDWTAANQGINFFHYDTYATSIKTSIKIDLYRTPTIWCASLFPERQLRSAPKVMPVYDLRGRPGVGAIFVKSREGDVPRGGFAFSGGGDMESGGMAAGTLKEGKQWVVLTGLIPIEDQVKNYIELFSKSRLADPVRDMPQYAYYEVERCEETPTGRTEWKKLNAAKSYWDNVVNKWQAVAPEVVDPAYIPPTILVPMAYPLPPVDKKVFGEEVAHHSIPLWKDSMKEGHEIYRKWQEEQYKRQREFDPEKLNQFTPFGPGMSGSDQGGSGMGRMHLGGGMAGGSGYAGDMGQMESGVEHPEDYVTIKDYLFRFFDFEVEKDKTYRYRVQLYLINPNFNLEPRVLEDPNLSLNKFIASDYSAESNAVTVGTSSRVLAVGASSPKPRVAWNEPTASIMLISFDMDSGNEWFYENERIVRGAVANFSNVTLFGTEPKAAAMDMMGDGSMPPEMGPSPRGGRRPPRADARSKHYGETKDNQTVKSDVCIVDIAGGYELPTARGGNDAIRSPGRVLVMGTGGSLSIQSIGEDAREADRYKNPTVSTGYSGMGMGM